tara:strand:- start:4218 stop:5171 length:954 start_codon:yes stop_codon:yes gene_type:complete
VISFLKKIYFFIWSYQLFIISAIPNRPWFLFKRIREFYHFIEPDSWPNKIVTRSGLKWKLRYSKDHVSRAFIYNNGVYETHSYDLVNEFLKKGMTFIDVGANCGYYTILAGKLVGDYGNVISFEPSSKYFNQLEDNVKNNLLKNVHCINKGLSDKNESLDLVSDGSNASFVDGWMKEVKFNPSSVSNSFIEHHTLKKEKCNLVTLDDEIVNLKIEKLDFIKVDIEGYENNFYVGAQNTIKKYRPFILLEYTAGVSNKTILPSLSELNYRFVPENFNFKNISYDSLLKAKWTENPAGHILDNKYFYNILCIPQEQLST